MSPDPASPPSRRRRLLIPGLVVVALAGLLVVAGFMVFGPDDTPTRQEIVAQRGSQVMPFDLNATQHHFETTATGAVETVTANSPDDSTQVDLIRQHLRTEATRFEQGDYGDPAAIHGHDMPGLQTLTQSAGRIEITYTELPAGARITFTTDDPALRSALADWIMAQNMDHGTGMNHG
jgi:hypothetical protein